MQAQHVKTELGLARRNTIWQDTEMQAWYDKKMLSTHGRGRAGEGRRGRD